jgi:hypothetical protein
MTSHLEATKAAAPMDSVLFQDGTQSQASVPRPFQSSLPDGFCCRDAQSATTYFVPCLLRKEKDFIIVIALTSVYESTLVN